ncbi:MAG: DUF1995 family protein [Synechococcaceae cyanobacterium RM1_1_27]|nr:DUF1995 family protein [Synechococcaceae cyanobacterium SM2_3_2]NJO85936.1 DUF1995 family protein [Synechococcaceae cyanobacterium RM1_1_27]
MKGRNDENQAPGIPALPADLAEAQQQAVGAIQAAIQAGYRRVQVDIPVADLKPETVALPLIYGCEPPMAVVFSDAGSAALAQRDWPGIPEGMRLCSLGAGFRVEDGEMLFFVVPSVYAVEQVEQICDRLSQQGSTAPPVILFNPQLQDAATVGVGLAGRRLRDRFITTFEPVYYLQALGSAAVARLFPYPWGVWQQDDENRYHLVKSLDHRPNGEELGQILGQEQSSTEGLWRGIQRFLRVLQG